MRGAGADPRWRHRASFALRRALFWALPLLAVTLALPALWRATPLAASTSSEAIVREALAEGNRRVRDGELESAVDAYTAGWGDRAAGDLGGVLAYNLGTTLHRLERRPEALLWYLRAAPLRPGDRWLADNLDLVRDELAARRRPPPGVIAAALAERSRLALAAIVGAWSALALALLGRRRPPSSAPVTRRRGLGDTAAAIVAIGSILLWLAATTRVPLVPRPAVVLAPCADLDAVAAQPGAPADAAVDLSATPERDGALPAGSEVWVRRLPDGGWRVVGEPSADCPDSAIATY